jgi:hypothetical protein
MFRPLNFATELRNRPRMTHSEIWDIVASLLKHCRRAASKSQRIYSLFNAHHHCYIVGITLILG